MTVLVVAACAYAPDQAVLVQNTTVTTGNEFSGIVASPNHPGWYWAIRDVWKQEADPSQGIGALPEGSPDPVPSWCPAGDQASATGRNRCRRVERSSLYAIRLDAAGAVAEVRRVPLTDESWAEQPWRAENNDWEELSLGPTRVLGGVPTTTLLVGATGDGTKNPSKVESPPGSIYAPDAFIKLIAFMMIAFGAGFEFPVLLVALQLIGVLSPKTLSGFRRNAIVIIVIAAAVITPSADPISMLALALPMYIFYEVSIIIGKVFVRRKAAADAAAA